MEKLPPIAPVTAKGPLGVVHLPRMWAKALQKATGHLQDDYIVGCGLDRAVCRELGLDMEKAIAYIQSEKPSYLEYENWVVAEVGGVGPDQVRAANDAILGLRFDAEHARQFREELGLPETSDVDGAADLDSWDDLSQFHRLLTAS